MQPRFRIVVEDLLRQMKDRLQAESEYDYEAREIVQKIDRILAGKLPQKSCDEIKVILNEALR